MREPLQSLRIVDALSGATVHEFGRINASKTVVLTLNPDEAWALECIIHPTCPCTYCEIIRSTILEQLTHEHDRLSGE